MADEALQVVGQRDVFLVYKGDVPVRMLVKGDAVQGRVAHIVEDEVHRGGVALVLLAELVAEAEAARVEVDIEIGVFSATGLGHDLVDEEVSVLNDHGLSGDVTDRHLRTVIEAAAWMRDEEDLARKEWNVGKLIPFMQVRHESDIIFLVEDVLLDVAVGELHVVEMNRRTVFDEDADELRRQETQDAVGRYHAQEAFILQAQLSNLARGVIELCHHTLGMLVKDFAVLRRHDALLRAEKQRRAERLLHALDLFADSLRCHEERLRRR